MGRFGGGPDVFQIEDSLDLVDPYWFKEVYHDLFILALVLGMTMLDCPVNLVPGTPTPARGSFSTNKGIYAILADGMERLARAQGSQ
ncbi:MAG: hypothetical protein OXC91_06445 [Rhodobacteraceae bacterium]|nr:hypothetical protein [Paracoccaceae bacterium]